MNHLCISFGTGQLERTAEFKMARNVIPYDSRYGKDIVFEETVSGLGVFVGTVPRLFAPEAADDDFAGFAGVFVVEPDIRTGAYAEHKLNDCVETAHRCPEEGESSKVNDIVTVEVSADDGVETAARLAEMVEIGHWELVSNR